jgi:hypothetical protein
MGMFDNVRYEAPCYKCGHLLTGWQSKSGPCDMVTLEPWQVTNLYSICPKCAAWNEYTVDADLEIKVHSVKFIRVAEPEEDLQETWSDTNEFDSEGNIIKHEED